MLCSLPKAKPSSTWLDRLHTLKGFNDSTPPSNPNPNPNPNPDSQIISPNSDAMTTILADLFVMDPLHSNPTSNFNAKRGLRKQPTPKICILKNIITSADEADLTIKAIKKNHRVKEKKKKKKKKKKGKKRIEAGSGLKMGSGTKGRTEATVIDTSTPGWKSAKILIRKGSNWKIRDKKQLNAGLNKRKRLNLASNKEKELSDSEKPSDPLEQEDDYEDSIDLIQISVKRPKCSKLPSIPEAAKSIALHLKVRTNGKKKEKVQS
ncbi:hypothetical protein FCM35_KLT16267 [Carex littledalei]|uniref:Uncharacterized protein n=1 Tax=Carex littledalei TaxID=544730 RepID=A0A833RMX7_9POAL|nr:hypothetical protein FCM35_KLT16267 [Carex littledalei]